MKTVIMAGGRGTRIASIAPDSPKPLIPINGKPVLEREIECLRDQGFTDLLLTVGYKAEQLINYFGNGEKFGVHIEYYLEKTPLGNAGALFKIRDQLSNEFLLLNADAMFDIDFNRFVDFHHSKGGLVTLFTHPNDHPYDSGLIIADSDHMVIQWLNKEDVRPEWYQNRVNAGLHVINKEVLYSQNIVPGLIGTIDNEGKTKKVDLDRDLLKPLAGKGKMYCYDSPEYVKDMGTPDRYESVCKDYELGIVHQRNLLNPQRAVFLDRDGTINKYVGFLTDINQFELIEGVADAIREINHAGYLAIVVTNQPVIARGEVTVPQLRQIHNKMETLLGRQGAYLNAIYYCPHHPDRGYPGEIKELKITCECRKPKPGMLLKAAEEYNIDLSSSWMVGDGKNDIQAGINAGCHTALIGEEDFGQEVTVSSLKEFSDQVISNRLGCE